MTVIIRFLQIFCFIENIFNTHGHMADLLSDLLRSDLQISLWCTFVKRSLISGLFCPRNIPGFANSSEYVSLNILKGLFPSAGVTLRICCHSFLSKNSVAVRSVSVLCRDFYFIFTLFILII